jgi:hypothetical protein
MNSSDVTAPAKYLLVVSRQTPEQLTVCPAYGFSPWNVSCTSVAAEVNAYSNSVIGIYLNVNNTNDEDVTYAIERQPFNGQLYHNAGDETTMELGDPVVTGEIIVPGGDEFPDLIYIGNENYMNGIVTVATNKRTFVDNLGNPIWQCTDSVVRGCPDTFLFRANTSDGRVSNVGKYEIYVDQTVSPVEIFGPATVEYVLGVKNYFTGSSAITYNDPDGYACEVIITIDTLQGNIGFDGSLENLTFVGTNECFNSSTGCPDVVMFYAYEYDVKRVVSTLFYWNNKTLESQQNAGFTMSATKQVPDCRTSTNAFFVDPAKDPTKVWSAHTYSRVAEYEDDIENADDYNTVRNQETKGETNTIIAGSVGGVGWLLLLVTLFIVWWYRSRVPIAEGVTVETAISTAAGNIVSRVLRRQSNNHTLLPQYHKPIEPSRPYIRQASQSSSLPFNRQNWE